MWRGGETTRRHGKTNHRQNPPAYRRRGGGGETKKGELKENTGAKARKITVKTLPQATIVARGGETKGKNQHEMERRHNPQSREGGRCLAENAYPNRKQNKCITRKRTQNIQSCATVCVARLPWPPPGSELRRASAGRQKKLTQKPTVPCLSLVARLPRPWPSTE